MGNNVFTEEVEWSQIHVYLSVNSFAPSPDFFSCSLPKLVLILPYHVLIWKCPILISRQFYLSGFYGGWYRTSRTVAISTTTVRQNATHCDSATKRWIVLCSVLSHCAEFWRTVVQSHCAAFCRTVALCSVFKSYLGSWLGQFIVINFSWNNLFY